MRISDQIKLKVNTHQMQEAETASDQTAIVHYHEEEAVYITAQTDRVTVIFSTLFKDPDDIVIGKVS